MYKEHRDGILLITDPSKDISSTATERSGCLLSFPKRPNPKNTATNQKFVQGCYHLHHNRTH